MTSRKKIKFACLLAVVAGALSVCAEPVRLVFDTDISPDFDDVGAMAVMHKLADDGEAEILATVACNRTPLCVPVIEIINAYYGRSALPVGAVREGGVAIDDQMHQRKWPVELATKYATDIRHKASAAAPSAVSVYRRALAAAPDGSVTVCAVGFLTNLADLLDSPPDAVSPLNGRDLVRRKVKALYTMAGYAKGGREFNVYKDAASSKKVFDLWPTEIVVSPAELGSQIRTGKRVAALQAERSPIRDAFAISLAQADKDGRQSWDETTVYAAVRGGRDLFVRERGRFAVTDEKGTNTWTPDPKGPHEILKLAVPPAQAAQTLEGLMVRAPGRETDGRSVEVTGIGPVKLTCANPRGWSFALSKTAQPDGTDEVTIRLSADKESAPPPFSVSFDVPQLDMHHRWFADYEKVTMPPDWNATVGTRLGKSLPVIGFLNDSDRNRLTVSCSEAKRTVRIKAGLREEDCHIVWQHDFFSEPEAPLKEYVVRLRFDRRNVFFGEAISSGADWMAKVSALRPLTPPASAFDPLYSAWYSFHQNVSDREIEAECAVAAKLGMKTVIVDDGWQTDDNNRGYQFTGDWQMSKKRFPDFAAHVKRVQAMGMKYMIWYSVPFVGPKSANYARFKGKYLGETRDHATLDPRFPEVREFLCGIYERAMREWGLDGLKLDFIDSIGFYGKDPAVAENYAGRDIKALPEAVDRLMTEASARIRAVKSDALIEVRQLYVGPAIRQYGNMLRAGDCPGDLLANRCRTANLRLTSGTSAVHADMLEWNVNDTPETAARFVLASLFSVIQYSVMLRTLPDAHRRMIAHWLDFSQRHRETLLKGDFRPRHFEAFYPVIEAESAAERIVAVYNDSVFASCGKPDKPVLVINATGGNLLVVDLQAAPSAVEAFDTFGKAVGQPVLKAGLNSVAVPQSGYLKIVP